MMLQTGSWHRFSFFFLLFTLHLSPILAYFLKDCTILYSDNVTAGVSVDCTGCDLDGVPDDIPRDVVSLILENNLIQKIHVTDFYHLSNLTDLNLSDNSITRADDGAFVHLKELQKLHMNINKLRTLTANMFQGLSNLLILRLDGNYIKSIDPAAFHSLTSLQELNLKSNFIHHMTDVITILQLPLLQVLNISIHELESFQSKDLPLNMTSDLRELRISSVSIKTFGITTAVFPHLKTIDLLNCCNTSGWEWDIPDKYLLNGITKVYLNNSYMSFDTIKKSLQSLNSLEYLRLSHMGKWIDRGLLNVACKIPTLRTLNLQQNSIANLSEKLTPCTQLNNLDLSINNLTELSKDSIKQMKRLSHLNLASNELNKVPDDVRNLPMLQILIMADNYINDLSCSDFLNLTRLTELHLDNNRITALQGCVFEHLSELKNLTVTDNFIETFGSAFKIGLRKVELLDLNRNSFMFLRKGDFKSLKSLKHLHVESDALAQLDGSTFEGLDELETLSLILYGDYVEPYLVRYYDFPSSLSSLKSLTIRCVNLQLLRQNSFASYVLLDMSNLEHFTAENVYNELPDRDTFKHTPRLKSLSLRRNNLTFLSPELFAPIPNLDVFDLSYNKLSSLDFLPQANLTQLSWLDLSHNELMVINVSVFSFLPALRYVYMGDNPFVCACSNSDFHQRMLNNNQTQVVGAHSYTCAYPLGKRGTRFLDFDIHSCWVDTCFICYIFSTCVIVLTLLTSFTYHFLRLHLLYAYYLFLAFLHDAKERKRGSPQRYDAFISYNVHDELWVYSEMLPVLEGEQGWKLCLHHRDFLPGKPIIENITDAIYGSRKTICVISRHYLESEWCSTEIQMASYRLFDERKDVLILVFLEDIPAHQLSPYYHMRRLVKRHSYLSWSQAGHPGLFWQNLCRALETGGDSDRNHRPVPPV